jgi:hypothetical protein
MAVTGESRARSTGMVGGGRNWSETERKVARWSCRRRSWGAGGVEARQAGNRAAARALPDCRDKRDEEAHRRRTTYGPIAV